MTPAIFDFEAQTVRVLMRDGQPWWVAVDVCCALGLVNSRKAVNDLDEDERMTVTNSDSHSGQRGGAQSFQIVSESGLFHLIFKSRKEEAKRFRKWVTSEVLPALRAAGTYTVGVEKENTDATQRVPTELPEPVQMMSVVQFLREHGRDWPGQRQVDFTKSVRTFVRVMGAQEGKVDYGRLGMLYAVPVGVMEHVLATWRAEGAVPLPDLDMQDMEALLQRAHQLHGDALIKPAELVRLAHEVEVLPQITGEGVSVPAQRSFIGKLCNRAAAHVFASGVELKIYSGWPRKYQVLRKGPQLQVVKSA